MKNSHRQKSKWNKVFWITNNGKRNEHFLINNVKVILAFYYFSTKINQRKAHFHFIL